MARWTTEAIEHARAMGRSRLESSPCAIDVRYDPATQALHLVLNNDVELKIPADRLQGLSDASDRARGNVHLEAFGTGIHFPDLDADFSVAGLAKGIYGSAAWMQAIGSKGGRASTPPKRRAARNNGKRGGRPSRRMTDVEMHSVPTPQLLRKSSKLTVLSSGPKWTSYCLKAANGRILGTLRGASDSAMAGVEGFLNQVAGGRVSITHSKTPKGYRIVIESPDAGMVFRSKVYASKSTMSRAKSTIVRALQSAPIEPLEKSRA